MVHGVQKLSTGRARPLVFSGIGGLHGLSLSACYPLCNLRLREIFNELLLGPQEVGEDPVRLLNFVELLQFCLGFVAEVSDEVPDPAPVLPLPVGGVLVPRPGPGEGDRAESTQGLVLISHKYGTE